MNPALEHACDLRNSAYTVNLTYDRHTYIHTYIHTNIHTDILEKWFHIFIALSGPFSYTLKVSIKSLDT